ncbi:epoxide hydrolase 1 [Pochonia chlamydosporia 170]|uniref:Epoxide hydrolase 1 n=1 Tax=Pochonia chlamydosporia 170 TaxID=1380566 RepID=A0A179F184_METCM|nr:epoxide hydrolase 1 [Pochonia chlamydosporia 170]OAQ59227.1 epoxide hydrolase 1 [Pochonia chlamydosporia 170]
MADYANIPPNATLNVHPFKAHVDEAKLQHFRQLLELSPIGPAVFENTNAGNKFGIKRDWLVNAKNVWLNDFDWRKHEDRINSYPNFQTTVQDSEGNSIDVHFLALFSEKKDAVPIAFFHGWPGSVCDFIDMLDLIKQKYSPADLPYHVIVPSLPGYAYSSSLPLDVDYGIDLAAGAMHNLMLGLGFGSGYLVQGGDVGSFVSRMLALQQDACKGMHVTQMGTPPLDKNPPMSDDEKLAVHKATEFMDTANGFALEQGQRPATIGLALSASPLALLSWIGEKLLAWTDDDVPLDKILESVTLYWMTDTFPRAMYHNRGLGNAHDKPKIARTSVFSKLTAIQLPYVDKPCGYSLFANEIVPVPKSWAEKSCNLVTFNKHDAGGHFAAMEKPHELLADVEEYIKVAWRVGDSASGE